VQKINPTSTLRLPRALFIGLFLAGAALGLAEGLSFLWSAPQTLGGLERTLLAAYGAAPFVAGGALLGSVLAGIAGLWTVARRTGDETDDGWAVRTTSGLLAAGVFLGVFAAIALKMRGSDNTALSLTLATPMVALGAVLAWAIFRRLLSQLGQRIAAGLGLCILLSGVASVALLFTGGDGLGQSVGRWPPMFLGAFAGLSAIGTLLLYRRPIRARWPVRGVIVLGLLGCVGVVDMVLHLDDRAAIKPVLLSEGLAVPAMIRAAQPLFDADQDGYAGRLGGGDCDDSDPKVYPGAREIPRNGRDEDCFEGDSVGRVAAVVAPTSNAPRSATPKPATSAAAPVEGLKPRPNIILLTVDTLRADHMGYAGYDAHPITPHLDDLANAGLRFEWAFAQGAQTKQSMPSMFVGKYFSEVARTPHHWATTLRENETLAERMKAAGYKTIGVPAHNFFRPNYGLRQGFDVYDLAVIEEFGTRTAYGITGRIATSRAIHHLGRQSPDKPWFLWLHLFDPHHFYKDHKAVDFGSDPKSLYAEEVWYTDSQVGRLMAWLKASKFADNTYVMLSADHAEAFEEHGYTYHGQTLNNDQLHVPMFISGPGLPSRSIQTPVSNIDIVPTLTELAGIRPDPELRGVSLLRYVDNPKAPHPPVFAEMVKDSSHSARRVIVDWPYKLQWGITFNTFWLYDLSADPTEQKNLATREKAVLKRLTRRLRQWMSEEVEPFDAEAWAKKRAAEIAAERRADR
jgi:arylsulfatase A-like enzyme